MLADERGVTSRVCERVPGYTSEKYEYVAEVQGADVKVVNKSLLVSIEGPVAIGYTVVTMNVMNNDVELEISIEVSYNVS